MIHLQAATPSSARMLSLIDFALAELREDAKGTRGVLLRLAELMFVEVVRRQLESGADAAEGWLAGLHDPVVALALAARRTGRAGGASRSVLAERFTQFVGHPPMQYLTHWRMQLAIQELVRPGSKRVAVAQVLGCESEVTFSAFKRPVGVPPANWRRHQSA